MRVGRWAAIVILLVGQASSRGGDPVEMLVPPYQPPLPNEISLRRQPTDFFSEGLSPGQQQPIGVHLLLGVPLGVRVEATVAKMEQKAFAFDAFVGFSPGLFGTVGAFGVGGRVINSSWTTGGHDEILYSPGLNVFLLSGGVDHYFVAPDIEITWVRHVSPTSSIELGIDLGGGIGTSNGKKGLEFMPIVAFVGGWRF